MDEGSLLVRLSLLEYKKVFVQYNQETAMNGYKGTVTFKGNNGRFVSKPFTRPMVPSWPIAVRIPIYNLLVTLKTEPSTAVLNPVPTRAPNPVPNLILNLVPHPVPKQQKALAWVLWVVVSAFASCHRLLASSAVVLDLLPTPVPNPVPNLTLNLVLRPVPNQQNALAWVLWVMVSAFASCHLLLAWPLWKLWWSCWPPLG